MSLVRSEGWVTFAARHRARGGSFEEMLSAGDRQSTMLSIRGGAKKSDKGETEPSTLSILCLRSLESSLGKGLATFDLQDLPMGLGQLIYDFVSSKGSRMAHMELLKALAPLLRRHVYSLDFSKTKVLGDSALLMLATGCDSSLLQLDLSSCSFVTDVGLLAALLKCPFLRDLTLSGCAQISDQTAFHLPQRCTDLATLNLAGLQGITHSGVAYISFLPALEHLCLARCNVGDEAVVALAAGPCRQSLRRLDLSGTATKSQCLAALRGLRKLEFLTLSSTDSCISVVSVAALARDLRLPASLPEAPKTRGRCSRSLLSGSKWSERQLRCVPRKRRAGGAGGWAGAPARSWQDSTPTVRYGHRGGGSSKAIRLMDVASRLASSSSLSSSSYRSNDLVEVGVQEGGVDDGGRQLLLSLIQGIVKLWPAVPSR
eukprot:g14477.t1